MAEQAPSSALAAVAALAMFCAAATGPAQAQEAPSTNTAGPAAYGEEPYRLGAGDVLSIQLYGMPETLRPEVTVAPDGTISYLSAIGLDVRGRTITETRRRLEETLLAHYRKPQVIISPVGLVSKSYTVMGMVKRTGIFPMSQPITLIEALSRAGGTVSGLFDRRYVDLADLQRSFLLRGGKRMPVNFYKLMIEGDMSHNIALEPGDYIQIASALANDYYVLGAVKKPGREGFTEGASVMSAIAKRLGFEDTSYREHVLVVRGSMQAPETFVINTDAILKGSRPDFLLQPKDIVYVSNRPWQKVEDVLDNAVSSFVEASTAVWTGANVPVIFRDAILPTTIYNTNDY